MSRRPSLIFSAPSSSVLSETDYAWLGSVFLAVAECEADYKEAQALVHRAKVALEGTVADRDVVKQAIADWRSSDDLWPMERLLGGPQVDPRPYLVDAEDACKQARASVREAERDVAYARAAWSAARERYREAKAEYPPSLYAFERMSLDALRSRFG